VSVPLLKWTDSVLDEMLTV